MSLSSWLVFVDEVSPVEGSGSPISLNGADLVDEDQPTQRHILELARSQAALARDRQRLFILRDAIEKLLTLSTRQQEMVNRGLLNGNIRAKSVIDLLLN